MSGNLPRFLAVLFICTAIQVWAQTSIPAHQIRGSTSASGQVFVSLPSGAVTQALLAADFAIDTSGPRPVLRIAVPSGARVVRVKVVAGETPPQSFQIAASGVNATNVLVYRNGLLQSEGDDYAFTTGATAGTVAFNTTSVTAVQSGDIIQLVAIL